MWSTPERFECTTVKAMYKIFTLIFTFTWSLVHSRINFDQFAPHTHHRSGQPTYLRMFWTITRQPGVFPSFTLTDKKLSCRRNRALLRVNEYFAKSLKVIPLSLLVFLCNHVCTSFRRDLEIWYWGRLRKLKMAPFDEPCTTFHWLAIVRIYFYVVPFSTYLTLNNIAILKSMYGSLKIIGNGTIQKLGYGFLFAFHSYCGWSCIVSEIWRDIARKPRFFNTTLYWMPPLWGSPSEFYHAVWCG